MLRIIAIGLLIIPVAVICCTSSGGHRSDHIMIVAVKRDNVILHTYLNESNVNNILTFSELPLHNVTSPRCVGFDPVDEVVYWSDKVGIYREFIDGSSREEFIESEGNNELEVDYLNRKLYWTDDYLFEINLNGSSKRQVCNLHANQTGTIRSLDIDANNGIMYFTTIIDVIITIGSLNLTNCRICTRIHGDAVTGSIAFDNEQNSVSWMWRDSQVRANFADFDNGICNATLRSSFSITGLIVRDIATYQSYVFFTCNRERAIGRRHKNGSDEVLFDLNDNKYGSIRLEIERVLSKVSSIDPSPTSEMPSEEFSRPTIGLRSIPSDGAIDEMYLSAEDNIAGKSLASWITSQESDTLHQLQSSPRDSYSSSEYQSVYSTASWIGNETNILKNIETKSNRSASASVKIPMNEGNLAIVFIYIESDILATGPGNDVPLDATTSVPGSGDFLHTYLISGMLTISIFGTNDTIDAQVEFSLPLIPLNKSSAYEEEPACAFYDITTSKWSTRGCEVLNVTEQIVRCFCSHLTSFAVLMQISSHQLPAHHEVINSWITTIGLSLSVVTLTINLLIYTILLRKDKITLRHKIHINLIVCMIGVDVIFLTAINKTENQSSCKFVSMFLHYLLLCMFMWMLAEAVFLVIKVIKNAINQYKLKYFMLVCYTTPAFIVAIVAAGRYDCYVTETLCWLRSPCRLAVAIPALLIIGVNTLVLGKMIYVIYTRSGPMLMKPPKIQKEYKQLRNAVRGSFVLLPILGVTWILGPFAMDTKNVYIVYLFNILNSLQGVFVFVVCCLLDNEVREVGSKWISMKIRGNNRINDSGSQVHRDRDTLPSTSQPATTSTTTTHL